MFDEFRTTNSLMIKELTKLNKRTKKEAEESRDRHNRMKKRVKKLERGKSYKPIQGRWDGTIERSLPEIIRLTNTLIERKQPKSR
jgi:hypothetical protein